MLRLKLLAIPLMAVLFISNIASAQSCADGYTPSDRRLVLDLFRQSTSTIIRMQEIAIDSSTGVYSVSQRGALELEYQALMQHLDELGRTFHLGATRKTRKFLDAVLDPDNLELSGSSVTAPTIYEAQQSARAATISTSQAIANLWNCF